MRCLTVLNVLLVFISVYVLNGADSKEYYVRVSEKVSWQKAFMRCKSQGLQLATVNSEDEDRDLQNAVRASGKENQWMWLSGTSLGSKWMWMSTGVEVLYTNWAPNQPDFPQEKCMHIWPAAQKKYTWNNWHCHVKLHYICESPVCECSKAERKPGPPSVFLQYPDDLVLKKNEL